MHNLKSRQLFYEPEEGYYLIMVRVDAWVCASVMNTVCRRLTFRV